MKIFVAFFTTWLLTLNKISADAKCILETTGPSELESANVVAFSCIDANAEEFIYNVNFIKAPIGVSFQFEFQNISISNSYIINEIQQLTQNAHDLNKVYLQLTNNLTDFDLRKIISGVPNLTMLNVSHNSLENFIPVDNSKLEYLNLEYNVLNELSENYNLENITVLKLSHCSISRMSKHVFRPRQHMKEVDLSHNSIKSLNASLALICSLEVLNLNNNLIEVLRESDICHASRLYLEDNLLFTMDFGFKTFPFERVSLNTGHLGKLYNTSLQLQILYRPYQNVSHEIETITFNPELKELPSFAFARQNRKYGYQQNMQIVLANVSLDHVSDNAFNGLNEWESVFLNSNKIKILRNNMFNNTKLSVIDLSDCEISFIEPYAFYGGVVKELYLTGNKITSLNSNIFCSTGLTTIDISYNKLHIFDYLACENRVEKLNLQFNNIKSIDSLGNLVNLVHLNVSHNKIKKLDSNFAYYFPNIQYLDLSDNHITSISANTFITLENLKILNLENNMLDSIDQLAFSYDNLKLETLKISYNGSLEEEQFSKLVHLKSLTLANSEIRLLTQRCFIGLVQLRELVLDNTTIDRIEFESFIGLASLQDMDFSTAFRNQSALRNGMFTGLSSVLTLNISYTNLEEIKNKAFEGLENLNSLILSHNMIRDLEIGSFINLETVRSLHLNNNKLTKLIVGIFSGLENLEFLDLSYNTLQVIKNEVLFPLRNLVHLELGANEIIEIPHVNFIKTHNSLKYLGIRENIFKCDYLVFLLGNLTIHNIYYRPPTPFESDVENIDGIYCVDLCKFVYCPEEEEYYRQNPQ